MEILTTIAASLAAGAASKLEGLAGQALGDAYEAVKSYLTGRYPTVSISKLEGDPKSKVRLNALEKELNRSNAHADRHFLTLVEALIDQIHKHPNQVPLTAGVNLRAIKAGSLRISDVEAEQLGVNIEGAHVREDITIEKVRAGKKNT